MEDSRVAEAAATAGSGVVPTRPLVVPFAVAAAALNEKASERRQTKGLAKF